MTVCDFCTNVRALSWPGSRTGQRYIFETGGLGRACVNGFGRPMQGVHLAIHNSHWPDIMDCLLLRLKAL